MGALTNPKQELFAQFVAQGISQSEAYIRAGYSEKGKTAGSSRLFAQISVKQRVTELQEKRADKAATRAAVTVDSLTEMLIEDRALAHSEGQAGAAVSAVATIAKLHGLLIDRKEIKATLVDELDYEERARLLEALGEATRGFTATLIEGECTRED